MANDPLRRDDGPVVLPDHLARRARPHRHGVSDNADAVLENTGTLGFNVRDVRIILTTRPVTTTSAHAAVQKAPGEGPRGGGGCADRRRRRQGRLPVGLNTITRRRSRRDCPRPRGGAGWQHRADGAPHAGPHQRRHDLTMDVTTRPARPVRRVPRQHDCQPWHQAGEQRNYPGIAEDYPHTFEIQKSRPARCSSPPMGRLSTVWQRRQRRGQGDGAHRSGVLPGGYRSVGTRRFSRNWPGAQGEAMTARSPGPLGLRGRRAPSAARQFRRAPACRASCAPPSPADPETPSSEERFQSTRLGPDALDHLAAAPMMIGFCSPSPRRSCSEAQDLLRSLSSN